MGRFTTDPEDKDDIFDPEERYRSGYGAIPEAGVNTFYLKGYTDGEANAKWPAGFATKEDGNEYLRGYNAGMVSCRRPAIASNAFYAAVGVAERNVFIPIAGPNGESVGIGKFENTNEVRTTSATGGQKGVKPERYDLLPVEALAVMARLYGFGAEKYAAHNWRKGYDWSKSYASLMRHATQFWAGEDLDDETGLPHLAGVAFHAFTLIVFMQEHPDYDDRWSTVSKKAEDEIDIEDFNAVGILNGLGDPKYSYGIEDIELKFPTGHEYEEAVQKIASIIWQNDNHYTDISWERAWELREHDSFTDLAKHIQRVHTSANQIAGSGLVFGEDDGR